ncbi:MAG: response regulator [Flavobacterium sp.]|nr:MAG: response regulator [Flavobacterium sp.]
MHILLADDDADDRSLFREALEGLKNVKAELDLVNDGIELMDYLNNAKEELPHILFLDLNMPRKSGMECLHEIRGNSKFRDVSVAIYSTSNSEKDIEDTLSGGANIYIHKPDNFEKLKKTILHVLRINWQFHLSGMSKETFFLSI